MTYISEYGKFILWVYNKSKSPLIFESPHVDLVFVENTGVALI